MADRKPPGFAQFLKEATKPRPEAMGAGERAACLWWASLSPLERERMHGIGEAQELHQGGESQLEPRWQVGRLTRDLWVQLSRFDFIHDRIARAAYRWWADLGESERCDVFGQCCPDWKTRLNGIK